MTIKKLYANGKKKALTFSYDDGVGQDIPLLEIFNRYGLKCTFNLNSGLQTSSNFREASGVTIRRIEAELVPQLYKGHEIACHGLRHPRLEQLEYNELLVQVGEDKKNLEKLMGHEIRGMAYPYGTWNDLVISVLKEFGITYARTIKMTHGFGLPEDFLTWETTARNKSPELFEIGQRFLDTQEELALCYIWGHSYEFEIDDSFERMERFCKLVKGNEDVWYATNIEIADYIIAMRKAEIGENYIINNSDKALWFEIDGKTIKAQAGQRLEF